MRLENKNIDGLKDCHFSVKFIVSSVYALDILALPYILIFYSKSLCFKYASVLNKVIIKSVSKKTFGLETKFI